MCAGWGLREGRVVMTEISEIIKNIKHARLVILIIVLFHLPFWSLQKPGSSWRIIVIRLLNPQTSGTSNHSCCARYVGLTRADLYGLGYMIYRHGSCCPLVENAVSSQKLFSICLSCRELHCLKSTFPRQPESCYWARWGIKSRPYHPDTRQL